MDGWHYLPRYIDKIRLHLAGRLHADYQENLGKGFDGMWLKAAGLSHAALVEAVKNTWSRKLKALRSGPSADDATAPQAVARPERPLLRHFAHELDLGGNGLQSLTIDVSNRFKAGQRALIKQDRTDQNNARDHKNNDPAIKQNHAGPLGPFDKGGDLQAQALQFLGSIGCGARSRKRDLNRLIHSGKGLFRILSRIVRAHRVPPGASCLRSGWASRRLQAWPELAVTSSAGNLRERKPNA
jgi:hypothetical protein